MKTMIVLAALVISGSAFAYPTPNQSWDQLLADRETRLREVPFAGVFGETGILNACVSGDEFKSVQPVKTCLRSEERKQRIDDEFGSREETISYCLEYGYKAVAISRSFNKDVCVEWKFVQESDDTGYWTCMKSTRVAATYGLSYDIPVYSLGNEGGLEFAFTKNFQVPACE